MLFYFVSIALGSLHRCHRFNLFNNCLCDVDSDGEILNTARIDLSIEDGITIYDGEIVSDADWTVTTYPWDLNEDFLLDVDAMWEICKRDPKLWNAQINTLGAICDIFTDDLSLSVYFNRDNAERALSDNRIRYTMVSRILTDLRDQGLISSLYFGDDVSFEFKNDQVKRCLTVAGQILELYVALRMIAIKDEDGYPLYNDVKVGTVIAWGHSDDEYETPTVNEVDVIAMRGAIPVFISCKNGFFDADELYKLNTVAERFGGKYSKKVIVATEMDRMGLKAEYLEARMEDMGIRCIDALDEMSDPEIERVFSSLWRN